MLGGNKKKWKKEKVNGALPEVCSPYALCEEKKKVEMNRMTQHENDFHHQNHTRYSKMAENHYKKTNVK
jgi:hypothetical protein